jgi:prepilin-type N-terminal cleavage/methylation domain-containing protein
MNKANRAKLAGFTPLDKKYQTGLTPLDKKYQMGFTLMELLVSLFIIALLSSIFLANMHYGNQQGELNMVAQKLASDIRLTQSYALGLKEFGGSRPEGGWGIYFDETKNYYTIYADIGGFKVYNIGEEFQDIKLPDSIVVNDIRGDGGPIPNNWVHITFEPPDPTIHICRNSAQCNYNNTEIILAIKNGSETKTIFVNKLGLVDVED